MHESNQKKAFISSIYMMKKHLDSGRKKRNSIPDRMFGKKTVLIKFATYLSVFVKAQKVAQLKKCLKQRRKGILQKELDPKMLKYYIGEIEKSNRPFEDTFQQWPGQYMDRSRESKKRISLLLAQH